MPTSDLQRQLGQTFSQLLDPTNQQFQRAQQTVGAMQPLFERGLSTIREQAPSRFNTAFLGEQGRALQDFNALTADVLMRGGQQDTQNFLQALGMGGQYSMGQQGLNMGLLQQLLGQVGAAGAGPAVLTQNPGGFANTMGAIGTLGGLGIKGAGMFGGGVG